MLEFFDSHTLLAIGLVVLILAPLWIYLDHRERRKDALKKQGSFSIPIFEPPKNSHPASSEVDTLLNYYEHCDVEWQDYWSSACDDECPICGAPITPYKSIDTNQCDEIDDEVELIASGYEWECPICGAFNKEIEITEKVECDACFKIFRTGVANHAFS